MLRPGERIPHIRVPALTDGTLTYFDWKLYSGRWMVLCSIPTLGLIDTIFLDHQTAAVEQYDAALIALCQDDGALQHPGIYHLGALQVPILADPLRRLHRAYGLPVQRRYGRCH